MTKKILLIAATFMACSLLLDTNEAQAQGWRNYNRGFSNRGLSARLYSYPSYGSSVYSNRSYGNRYYSPYNNYSSRYGNYSGYGYPSGYSYGSNYGYRPLGGISFSFGNGGLSNYRGFGY